MHRLIVGLAVLASLLAAAPSVAAPRSQSKSQGPKPWCAPEMTELSDRVCYSEGGTPEGGRRTLVIYLHGALAKTPGFQYVQQRWMAQLAKRHAFTVLMPTGPSDGVGYVWPTSQKDLKAKEPEILASIDKSRRDLETRLGHPFDETFVIGFSSGAYYGSSLAVRGALDIDGYIVLAGGSAWVRREDPAAMRAPVFVGVSTADRLSVHHSRALAGSLRAMGWTVRAEERRTGHGVDPTFIAHGLAWLRAQKPVPGA